MVTAAVRSKAVVLLLLIHCFVAAPLLWQQVLHLSFVVWLYNVVCYCQEIILCMGGDVCLTLDVLYFR